MFVKIFYQMLLCTKAIYQSVMIYSNRFSTQYHVLSETFIKWAGHRHVTSLTFSLFIQAGKNDKYLCFSNCFKNCDVIKWDTC